jgi:diguanylate cyclase (GGDEF)-like protein/PAS domain S-box-containing protein
MTNLLLAVLVILAVMLLISGSVRRARTAEDNLHWVTEAIPEHIAVIDRDLRYRFCNARYAAMFGTEPARIIGRFVRDVVEPGAREEVESHLNAALAGDTVNYERELRVGDGEPRFIEAVLLPQRLHGRGRGEVWVVARDITARKQAELKLRAAVERLELSLEASEVSLWEWDRQGDKVFLAKEWSKIIGGEIRETYTTTDEILGGVHPDDVERVKGVLKECFYGKRSHYVEERRVRTLQGGWRWLMSRGRVIERDEKGYALRMSGTHIDITHLKESEQLITGQKKVLELIASGASLDVTLTALTSMVEAMFPEMLCSVLLTDKSGTRLHCAAAPNLPAEYNDAIEGITIGPQVGSCGTAAYRRERVIVSDIDSDPLWSDFRDLALRSHLRACWSQPILSLSGSVLGTFAMYYPRSASPTPRELEVVEAAGALVGIAVARKRDEDRLAFMAQFDTLTGLPNRHLLQDRLGQSMARAHRDEKQVAVIFLDLDRFKEINDTLGHGAGDRVLQAVSGRLRGCLRENDTVARLGGDEFTVILENIADLEEVHQVAQKILAAFAHPVAMEGTDLFVTPSLGIALYPSDGGDVESLLKHADMAMYHAKGKGRNNYQFYSSAMSADATDRMTIESSLRQALEREEFVLYYQPVLDIATQEIVGAEALLRWRHPQWGMVSPGRFIHVAEQTGLIVPIGEWILNQVCAQGAQWLHGPYRAVPIAVNLSARQFRKDTLPSIIREALDRNGLPGELLKLEITESLLMESPASSRAILEGLKKLGIGIALDDFGTGYSSLSYLKHFPLDIVKIDQSFVRDVVTDSDDAAIVKAMIGLAHNLQLKLTGEGVETEEQLRFLREQGCDYAQGYLFSRPVPAEEFAQMLSRQPDRRVVPLLGQRSQTA